VHLTLSRVRSKFRSFSEGVVATEGCNIPGRRVWKPYSIPASIERVNLDVAKQALEEESTHETQD